MCVSMDRLRLSFLSMDRHTCLSSYISLRIIVSTFYNRSAVCCLQSLTWRPGMLTYSGTTPVQDNRTYSCKGHVTDLVRKLRSEPAKVQSGYLIPALKRLLKIREESMVADPHPTPKRRHSVRSFR